MVNGRENLFKNIGEVALYILTYGILGLGMMVSVVVNWVEIHYGDSYFAGLTFIDAMMLMAIWAVPLMVRWRFHKNIENKKYMWGGIIVTVLPFTGFLITLPASYWLEKGMRGLKLTTPESRE